MKKLYCLFSFILLATFSYAQRSISGFVGDENGDAIIGANIIAEGTSMGTISDLDGNFILEDIPESVDNISISYTGYAAKTVSIIGLSTITITLVEGEFLNEVVVTALGVSREEKALGYAVQQVSAKSIANANTVSAIDALAGAAAGVQITSSSGAAGASSRIVLRGQTSFNGNNEALIVIDGMRIDNSENSTERSLGGVANSNRAIDINPNDIENVSILKGAAATALYGIEGARGVVLITTKSGGNNKVRVEIGSNVTISEVTNLIDFQRNYVQGSNGVWQGPETGQSGSWGPNAKDVRWDGSDYKWDKNGQLTTDPSVGRPFVPYNNVEDLFQTGIANNNTLAVSGGNKLSNYRFSFGNSNETGVVPNNTFDRYTLGLKLGTSLLNDKLELKIGANYVKSGGTRIQQGSNVSGIMLGLLRTPISFDNANGFDNPADEPLAYQFADNTQRNYRGGGGYDNPYWVTNNTLFNDNVNRFYGNFNAVYKLSPWLNFSALLGLDTYSDNRKQRFEIGSRAVTGGQVIEDNFNYKHTDFYLSMNGGGPIADKFSFNYNLGLNLYDQKVKNNYIQGDGLNFPGFTELGNTANISAQINNTNIKTAGLYGTVDFGYDNFLYLTLTARNDWSSTLINPFTPFRGADISFLYPSVSLGIIFSEKLDIPGLSFGKLRLSYAEVGGGAPSAYSTSTPFILPIQNAGTVNDVSDGWTNGLGFPFQGVSGFVYSGVAGNPFLKPSKTRDIEVGLDLRFMNDRIGLDLTGYDRNSTDQIIAINIPNTTGFQRAVVNSGELATIGGEVVLTLQPIKKENFTWNIGFNFSKWKTTVESLPEGVPNQYLDGFTGTGIYNLAPEKDVNGNITNKFEYGQILGGAFQRVNTGNGTFDADLPYNSSGALVIDDNPSSGNYGYPLVDPSLRVIGNPNPDWLLGINTSITYKNLTISALFDIKEGGENWNGTAGALTFFGRTSLTDNRGSVTVFEGVKSESGAANDISVPLDQSWYQGNGGGFGSVAEHFIENASFRRLRYVTLGYNFGTLLSSVGLNDLNLSITGRNLFVSTPYTGFDPEISLVGSSSNGQGLDYFQLPRSKSYTIGINASF